MANSLGLGRSRRQKWAARGADTSSLTTGERKALLEMLKLFEGLEKERETFSPRLQKLTGASATLFSSIQRPKRAEIESSLQQLQWTTAAKVKYQNAPERARFGRNTPVKQAPTWTIWENNPFHYYLDSQQIYNALIQKVQKAQQNVKVTQRSGVFSRGYQSYVWPSQETQKYQQEVAKAEEEITSKVALKLLDWMGQSLQLAQ
ncbi:hypothetical protein [Candidatus Mycoplasma haematominutum]|uniref:hypothetical protein n=1 Tax=Candidatus Mycoplasma haematominutum TaxID=209446 RepID=UPI0002F1BDDD|nr:hypothetical protein [Candidatus Mycoplasma haematominutum]